MENVEKLFEKAKHLKMEELSKLVLLLEEHLVSLRKATGKSGSFSRMLALSGIGRSDWSDVSSHKGEHLAEIYAPRRG